MYKILSLMLLFSTTFALNIPKEDKPLDYDDEDLKLPQSVTGRPIPPELSPMLTKKSDMELDYEICMEEYLLCYRLRKNGNIAQPICADDALLGTTKTFDDLCILSYENCKVKFKAIAMMSNLASSPPPGAAVTKSLRSAFVPESRWHYKLDGVCPAVVDPAGFSMNEPDLQRKYYPLIEDRRDKTYHIDGANVLSWHKVTIGDNKPHHHVQDMT